MLMIMECTKQIKNQIGRFVEWDKGTNKIVWGRRMRICVEMDISQPLMRGIKIRLEDGEERWVNFKFEKLPYFCYTCGLLGHRYVDCSRRFKENRDSDYDDLSYPKSLMVMSLKGGGSTLTVRGDHKEASSTNTVGQGQDHRSTMVARGVKGIAIMDISSDTKTVPHNQAELSPNSKGIEDDNLNSKNSVSPDEVVGIKDKTNKDSGVNAEGASMSLGLGIPNSIIHPDHVQDGGISNVVSGPNKVGSDGLSSLHGKADGLRLLDEENVRLLVHSGKISKVAATGGPKWKRKKRQLNSNNAQEETEGCKAGKERLVR